jgi:hypothetical protein
MTAGLRVGVSVLAIVVVAFAWSRPVSTQGGPPEFTQWATINRIEAGWGTNNFTVFLNNAPIVNPGRCDNPTGGYTSEATDPGVNLFHTVALSGLMNRKEVALLIAGCSYQKPRLYGIAIR